MFIDLHIHTNCSDGEIDLKNSIPTLYSNYKLVSFTDHENIFDPSKIPTSSETKFLSGVEICCNHNGQYIEILGYNFDPHNEEMIEIVNKVKELRISIIMKILKRNGFEIQNLPKNPFRINVPLPEYIDSKEFWRKNNIEYKESCHSISASAIINAIVNAQGIPVLAHPMESLSGFGAKNVEQFILSLGLDTVELITPKHSQEDIALISDIISRNHLYASIGSDSHQARLKDIIYPYNISEEPYEWIRNILEKENKV